MSRRTLLSPEQRARLFDVPTSPAEMAKYYVLSAEDLTLVRTKRRSCNRLGFAVQLCLLRHPGQGLEPDAHPPETMIAFVAQQLGCPPAAFSVNMRFEIRRDGNMRLNCSSRCACAASAWQTGVLACRLA